ncbi:MAG: tetratricopeptide repeat protein, partial [Bacteroidales bacterium]|nr:tetratricopeptide repeat protein [Bacteroidales bacterium]
IAFLAPELLKKACQEGKEGEARSYITYGNQFMMAGNYSKALTQFDKALSIDPNIPEAYINRGITYYLYGDLYRAEQDLRNAIPLKDKLNNEIFYYLGEIYLSRNEMQNAAIYYLKSAEIAPYPIYAYQKAGETFNNIKQFNLARKSFDLAFKNQFSMKNCYQGMLKKSYFLYLMDDVRQDIRVLLEKDIESVDFSSYDNQSFNEQMMFHPLNATLYNQMAYLYIQTQKLDSAKICLEKAVKIKPDFVDAQRNLDLINYTLQKKKGHL